MKRLQATGQATIRLTDKNSGRVDYEITAKNALNMDYAAEMKNSIFSPTTALSVYLSDYDQPSTENGIIFPMGRFLGYGKYSTISGNSYQGSWSPYISQMSKQQDGLSYSSFVWDFTETQAVGTLRSLFLYWDTYGNRYPTLTAPSPATYFGTPRWSVENKALDVVAKTATQYSVLDYYAKTATIHTKMNTLTVSGLARDVDSGHIFIFDAAAKKIYEFESLDVDMTAANILAEHPCTSAYFGKGLIRGDYMFYLSGSTDAAATANVTPTGATLYVYRYPFKTNSDPEIVDTLTAAEAGITQFSSGDPCVFLDDYLLHQHSTAAAVPSPVLRIVGDTARAGFTGVYSNTANQVVQRMTPYRQLLMSGSVGGSLTRLLPMALSHLLLPEPIVKDDQHRLSVSYTISIQD